MVERTYPACAGIADGDAVLIHNEIGKVRIPAFHRGHNGGRRLPAGGGVAHIQLRRSRDEQLTERPHINGAHDAQQSI
jgi:hypothetical protein